MAKRDNKQSKLVNPETKNSLVAIFLIGLASILILATFQKAGPVGQFVYSILNNLFGWGYYLLPTISILVALLFFFSRQRVFISTSIIGASLFVISGLGLMD